MKRLLIVNADDFGQSTGVNRGIIRAHEGGIVTSASMMVRWPAAADAAQYCLKRPQLSVGLHLDLGEWIFRSDEWVPVYEVAPLSDVAAVKQEIWRQLAEFRRLAGKNPTHIDSHQHVHTREDVRPLAAEMARSLGVPLRNCDARVQYSAKFYGQTAEGQALPELIRVDALSVVLRDLPAGVTELGCHPGIGNDLSTMYSGERAQEVETLCDPRIRAALARYDIRLCSFAEIEQAGTEIKQAGTEINEAGIWRA
jgi:predicted glycoside hydrolase/deacetylase ChbG (UPF0249 family)